MSQQPSKSVAYKKADFKYFLTEDAWWQTSIQWIGLPEKIEFKDSQGVILISLDRDGLLFAREGSGSDGPSGPTRDRPKFMRGAFGHDFLYALMREDLLDREQWREAADDDLRDWLIEDGMWPWWARNYVHRGVRWFAKKYTRASAKSPELRAP